MILRSRKVWLVDFLLSVGSHVHDDRAATDQCVVIIISGVVWIGDAVE